MRGLTCLILSCFVLFDCYLLEAYSFLKGNAEGVDLEEICWGRELAGGWKDVINCRRDVLYE